MFGAQKKCERCGKPATYKFTKFVNNKPVDRFYCEEHAAESSVYVQKQAADIKELLKSVVEGIGEGAASAKDFPDIRCSACGLSFEAYKRTLLLGCPECYRSFEQQMMGELRKFHGETRHVGRSPAEGATKESVFASELAAAVPEILADEEPPELSEISEDTGEAEVDLSIEELRRQLKEAVSREDFAEAARLRDHIKSQEQQRL